MTVQPGARVPTGGETDGTDEVADLFRALGRQVKVARERAGLSQKELGDRIGYAEETISSVERARRTPQPELLLAVDRLLDCGGLLASAAEDVERAKTRRRVRHPEWFRDYARLEAEAVGLCYFANQAVPGLFQTPEYARAVFTSRQPFFDEETVEERVAARMQRQELMTRWPPPTICAVVQESILRHPFGGREVQRGQLEQLLRIGLLRHVEIQVMPTASEEHAGMGGPFTLLTPKGRPQVAYLEVQHVSRLVTDPEEVRVLAAKHGSIRGQALTPRESLRLLEKMLGDL
ncbi:MULTISPECIES: helix-turn-helix domain-containing protein [Streptomyces]|jgi:Predicted transcription factor, homolog of eukaryotic MBF1|uniref:Helix-turn-helix protein n=1 Tax=Streptomyces fradiae ATCC 10745 = DSM 40063 TaxID=1319510 RepID=A0A1Y2NPJ4_STRFR|nr:MULTISPECIES: helix-turn-helix transcriptional regulator [Streptomyces]KAF0650770.1 XRE family transcriptional regulator [Streptomyces fradiae ATCC 10745 = DSM 40063]OSY48848.1 helix-turn-helix protein [Streptomyces fradiae ATCC 10745 = DSM 40063]QEV15121.1 XRE family transcriptional regulator [Streptomyces fradiae ATCC 10745 = DSM 40063]